MLLKKVPVATGHIGTAAVPNIPNADWATRLKRGAGGRARAAAHGRSGADPTGDYVDPQPTRDDQFYRSVAALRGSARPGEAYVKRYLWYGPDVCHPERRRRVWGMIAHRLNGEQWNDGRNRTPSASSTSFHPSTFCTALMRKNARAAWKNDRAALPKDRATWKNDRAALPNISALLQYANSMVKKCQNGTVE